jgi:DNA primase
VLSETFMRLLAERHPLDTAEGRSRCAHAAVALVRNVQDPLFRGQLCELVAERTQTPRARIEEMLGDGFGERPRPAAGTLPTRAARPVEASSQLWAALMARVLQLPQAGWGVAEIQRLVATGTRAAGILGAVVDRIEAAPGVSTARLLEQFRDQPFFGRLSELAGLPLGDEDAELSHQVALDSAERLFQEHCRARLRALSAEDRTLAPEEIDELRRLQELLVRSGRPVHKH